MADGRVTPQEALKGVVLTLGDGSGATRRLRIDFRRIQPEGQGRRGHALRALGAGSRERRMAQRLPARSGRPAARFSARRLDSPPGGCYEPEQGKLLITCTGGAEGKCVRFGYKPWGHAADGTPLLPYYQACVRLVRADYAGDGRGATKNSQPIDIYDRLGVQPPAYDLPYEFEAGFAPDGATCVRQVRVKENATLAGVEASGLAPRGRTGAVCD